MTYPPAPVQSVEEIVRGLSPAQTGLLMGIANWEAEGDGYPLCTIDVDARPRLALERRGLIGPEFELWLTDLGIRVAAALRGGSE